MTKTKFVRSKAYIHKEYKPNILARFVDYLIKRNILRVSVQLTYRCTENMGKKCNKVNLFTSENNSRKRDEGTPPVSFILWLEAFVFFNFSNFQST